MNRPEPFNSLAAVLLAAALAWPACSAGDGKAKEPRLPPRRRSCRSRRPPPSNSRSRASSARPASLMAEEQADVAAETAGRVIATPIERGTPVSQGAELIRISPTETDAQAQGSRGQRRADRSAARHQRRRGASTSTPCPKCRTPRPAPTWRRPSSRASSRCSTSGSCRSRNTTSAGRRLEAARQQYEAAKNGAAQQYQTLQAARARVALAHKALADTVGPRAVHRRWSPQRLVSTGDYVTKGMKVAIVVRVNPLRVQLTVPEQFVSSMARRPAGHLRGGRVSWTPVRGQGSLRLAGARGQPARADGRSDRAEPGGRAQAGPVCDRAHRAAATRRRP